MNKNLIIIGNGFDLSLGLHSSFNNYIGINSCYDYNTCHSKYARICYFVELFHSSQNELEYKINALCHEFSDLRLKPIFLFDNLGRFVPRPLHINKKKNGYYDQTPDGSCFIYRGYGFDHYLIPKAYFLTDSNGHLKSNHNGDLIEKSHIPLRSYMIAYDYFILKLLFNKSYRITRTSFSAVNGLDLDSFNNYDALNDALNELNKWGDQQTDKLRKASHVVRTNRYDSKINIWNLLMLFDMYIDIHIPGNGSNFFPKTWYDIENTIKEYLISIIDQPTNQNTKQHHYVLAHNYHTIDYYLRDADISSTRHFNFFTCINRYLDLLRDITAFRSPKSVSSKKNNYFVDSYSLYKEILKSSDYNDFLIHYTSQASDSIGDKIKIVEPFIFLILSQFFYSNFHNDKSLFAFLRHQLSDFEDDFSSYLCNQVKQKKNYKKESLKQFQKLSVTKDFKYNNQPFNVLDFNYTPIDSSVNCEHIHGNLHDRNIVIGIGEQAINRLRTKMDYNYYTELYSFTKTYQLFSFNRKANNNFLNNVQNIIFFGHSFGVNDFPYFEALFDHFHLYSNPNINLIFSYNRHGNSSYQDVKRRMVPRIVHLLKDYSRSLPNEAHRENLIAKMFTENRIKLYPVHF